MEVYVVWAFDQYYPTGPRDLRGIFRSYEEAQRLAQRLEEQGTSDYVEITTETVEDRT